MGYHERTVPGAVPIACVWGQTETTGDAPTRVVPDGCVDIIWSRADGDIHVAGPDTGPVLVPHRPGNRYAGVRFRPGQAAAVLGVPADALRDARVPLTELWGPAAARLTESVGSATDPETALLRATLPRVRAAAPPDPIATAVMAVITGVSTRSSGRPGGSGVHAGLPRRPAGSGPPRPDVTAIADRLGIGERQLRRRCLAAFGYGPKTVHRVLRFQRVLALARGGAEFAAAAHATGYADQAHLAREVRDLAGVPLGVLVGR